MVDASAVDLEDAAAMALLIVGRFEDDVAVVRRLRDRRQAPALLAAVAAGIPAFGEELGPAAEGVLGPAQWWPTARRPKIGPSGTEFVTRYRQQTGHKPSYPAAQAAATGYLAHAAHQLGLAAHGVVDWTTSTLLGDFALDAAWRQVGHRVTTVRWQGGDMVPITAS
jgi:ABC-type branched-subunit amino acid transport system substrate-binding protein